MRFWRSVLPDFRFGADYLLRLALTDVLLAS